MEGCVICVKRKDGLNVSYLYVCKMTPIDTIFSFLFILMLENVVRENTYGKHGWYNKWKDCLFSNSYLNTIYLYGHVCLIEWHCNEPWISMVSSDSLHCIFWMLRWTVVIVLIFIFHLDTIDTNNKWVWYIFLICNCRTC